MAKIGLRDFRYSKLTEAPDGTPSYDGAKKPAKAVSCTVDITSSDASLYADDALAESDTSFSGGTVTMGIDDEDPETMAELLGHTYDAGETIKNTDDVAPYVGLGRIVTKMIGGAIKYKVEFLYKVKFSEPSQSDTTKGETVEFGTSEIQGKVAQLANHDWNKTKTFDNKTDAMNYLNGLMAASGTSCTITYNVNGGTGTVTADTGTVGTPLELDDGSGITPPTNKEFIGWALTPTSTSILVSPYVPTGDVTLYAIYVAA